MVYCTREELRDDLWRLVHAQRELHDVPPSEVDVHPDIAPLPTAGRPNQWKELDQVHDLVAGQDQTTAQNRRKWKAKRNDHELVETREQELDAEKRRLGTHVKVVDPSLSIAAAMMSQQKDAAKDRTRITSNTGAGRGHSRRTRGLLHLQEPETVTPTSKLGPKSTVPPRERGENNSASRVIA